MSELDSAQAVEELRDHLLDKRWPSDQKACPPGRKPGAKRLSARSVNQVLSVFSGILESAWERGYISKNWGATKGRRARVKRRARAGSWVDYEPLVALLDAAHDIDLTCQRADTRNTGRRALLACLFLGAMRVSEAAQLQRRDVKWSRGVIQIPASKTAAGIAREVPMHRMLFDAMGSGGPGIRTRGRTRCCSRRPGAPGATATTFVTASLPPAVQARRAVARRARQQRQLPDQAARETALA